MNERIVADSTCLIALARISYLDIMSALFEPVLIPLAVELPTIKPVLQNLDDTGFYVSAALKEEALRLAGE